MEEFVIYRRQVYNVITTLSFA